MNTINISLSSIDGGDTVVLPGETTPRTVVRTWFVQKTLHWAIQVKEGANGRNQIYTFHTSDDRKATLVERPGYGPLNRTYEIGDHVYYRFGKRDNQFGVVIGFDVNPIDPTDRAYEIRSAASTGYAGPESMRYVDQPAYAIGQRWHCGTHDRYATILDVDDIGLLCTIQFEDTGSVGRYVLAAPFWKMIEDTIV